MNLADSTALDVELSQVNIDKGNFQGAVKAGTVEDISPSDTISFHCI